jgi:hypothetical protein
MAPTIDDSVKGDKIGEGVRFVFGLACREPDAVTGLINLIEINRTVQLVTGAIRIVITIRRNSSFV